MPDTWVVLLEAENDGSSGPLDHAQVRSVLEALGLGPHVAAIHCPQRYAVQVSVASPCPVEALADVISRWAAAVQLLDLPAWKLVRTEVLDPAELERELELVRSGAMGDQGGTLRDCDRSDAGRELIRRAFSDELTGLDGRAGFTDSVDRLLREGRGRSSVAVVSLDLDGFRQVNERVGYEAGDRILAAVARRLAATLRPADCLARFDGDGYAAAVGAASQHAALAVARRLVDACTLGAVPGEDLTLTASAGVALSDADDDAASVIAKAEAALPVAKAAGGGRAALYG